ncbi:thioredoxin family protein [Patescibacteria group bacterium]|nr:thioredoxin family protein [Patescibacteria group bacterium]MBU4453221.1 thioredoxin family protein [Patescibacteria group bacterium]MCG2687269.1 thioredoxin family protein [Candidatus Parcubacteria bacterium]
MALLEFYGEGCPHCIEMKPLVERLIQEEGVQVDVLEVWENKENAVKKDEYDTGACGGVPFFINTDTKAVICGSTDYESLKKWAGK